MAASNYFLHLHLILLLTSCFSSPLSSQPFLSHNVSLKATESIHPRVKLSLYYEALCPYCANFILNQLVDLFKTDILQIVDLSLVPWGNAGFKDKSVITCQHGPDECRLNTIEACIIQTWPDFRRHYGLIHCIERLVFTKKQNKLRTCFQNINEWKSLQSCYNSGLGTQLDLKYADETTHLNPPLKFVPWVVVNGQALKEDYGNFLAYVCRAYDGPEPKGCKSIKHKVIDTFNMVEEPSYAHQVLHNLTRLDHKCFRQLRCLKGSKLLLLKLSLD